MPVDDSIPLRTISSQPGVADKGPRTLRTNGHAPSPSLKPAARPSPLASFDDANESDDIRSSLLPKASPPSLASRSVAQARHSTTPWPPLPPVIAGNSGLLLVAISQLFFALMNITVKYFLSVSRISTLTLIAVRMLITGILCVLYLYFSGDPYPWLGPPPLRWLLSARGFFGFAGLFSNYQSYRGLSVSDSITIQFLAPSGTALLGYLWLGEKMTWRELAGGGCCLIGVLLVSRPPFLFGGSGGGEEEGMVQGGRVFGSIVDPAGGEDDGRISRMAGVGWALVCICTASIAYITIRAIGTRAHALHSMAYFAYFCVISSTVVLVFSPSPFIFVETWKDFGLIILIGIFGFIAQMFLTLGLQREKAGRASMALYLGLFYTLILELIIFHSVPPVLSFLGAGVIISSAVWVAMNKDSPSPTAPAMADDEESLRGSEPPTPISPSSPFLSPILETARSGLRNEIRGPPESLHEHEHDEGEDVDRLHDIPAPIVGANTGVYRQTSADSRASDGLRVDRHGLGRRRSINALRGDD